MHRKVPHQLVEGQSAGAAFVCVEDFGAAVSKGVAADAAGVISPADDCDARDPEPET